MVMEPNPPENSALESKSSRPINGFLVAGLILGPALLSLVAAMAKLESLAASIPVVGGILGGIICGVLFGGRMGKSVGVKVALGFLFAIIFFVLTLGLGFFGCMLGGYSLRFN
jgi:uncharacterized protein YacL